MGQPMDPTTKVRTRDTDFRQLCINGTLTEITDFLTAWQAADAAKPKDTLPSYASTFRPYGGFCEVIRHGRLDIVKSLMKEGFSIQGRGTYDFVTIATECAVKSESTEMLNFFLSLGWNPNIQDMPPCDGTDSTVPYWSTISMVIREESLVRWFLDRGVSPNATTYRGLTAITNACMYAPLDVVKLLVSRGADVTDKDVVAQAAIQHSHGVPGRLEVVEYVLDLGAPIDMCANAKLGPFWVSYISITGLDTALHHAVRGGNEDMVKLLLERGADKNLRTGWRASLKDMNQTALDIAEEKGYIKIAELLR